MDLILLLQGGEGVVVPIIPQIPMGITAHDLIRRAGLEIGITDPYEALDAHEASDGLDSLNQMLDSWSLEGLTIFQILQENVVLNAGIASYTIGPSGTFITNRPMEIISAFVKEGGIDYPIHIIGRQEYDRIEQKTVGYRPEYLFYEPSVPNGVITLWGVPGIVSGLYINSEKQLQRFDTLTSQVVLPIGYERAIVKNLAIEMAPQYRRTPSKELMLTAVESKANIERKNDRTQKLQIDHAQFSRRSNYSDSRSGFMSGY